MSEGGFNRINRRRRSSTRIGHLPRMPTYTEPVTFRYEIQSHTSRMQKITKAFQVYRLTALTIVCVLLGLIIGLICRKYAKDWTERHFMYIEMPGELYLRMLKLMIVPLLMSNIILSFGSIQGKLSSHLAKISSLFYLMSNLIAIAIAISLVIMICPGKHRFSSSTHIKDRSQHSYSNIVPARNYATITSKSPSISQYYSYKIQENKTRELNDRHDSREPMRAPENHLKEQDGEELIRSIEVKLPGSITLAKTTTKIFSSPSDIENQFVSTNEMEHKGPDQMRTGVATSLPIDILLDLLRNLIPDNLIGLNLYQTRTRLLTPRELVVGVNGTTDPPPSLWPMTHEKIERVNIIGLLAISVVTGVILSQMDESAQPMLEICACISELSLRFNMLAINLTPICIMSLLIGQVARIHDLSSIIGELSMYLITVTIALFVHGFLVVPLMYWIIVKRSPIEFLHHLLDVLVASFATSSSSATLAPLVSGLMQYNMNPVVVRAFGPLGSVFNMNGTTIYEIIGCLFLAQLANVDITLTTILLVGLTSAVAGLSTVGVPSAGMMTIVIVLDSINLPTFPLSLLYIFDFVIDRFRTVVNVWSGAVICALIDHSCPEHLFDEAKEHRKFLELMRFRPPSKKGAIVRGGSCVKDNREEEEPKVISITITPPVENQTDR